MGKIKGMKNREVYEYKKEGGGSSKRIKDVKEKDVQLINLGGKKRKTHGYNQLDQ